MTGPVRTLALIVPGEPFAKQRPRARALGKGRATIYTPEETKAAEANVRGRWDATHASYGSPDATSRFGLALVLCRTARYRRDVDNMAKTVMDALNGAPGAWADDYQVERLDASVLWVPKGEAETRIVVWTLGQVQPLLAIPTDE